MKDLKVRPPEKYKRKEQKMQKKGRKTSNWELSGVMCTLLAEYELELKNLTP